MLLALWSPKGGSGTSVFAAACALTAAGSCDVRLADLAGDLPALLGCAVEPDTGLSDWLVAGPEAPVGALERLAVDAAPACSLLPLGGSSLEGALPEAGAALGVVLRDDPRLTVADLGRARGDALRALVEVADVSIPVLRPCYLALRRAVRDELVSHATGVVLVDDPGRALAARDVADVLGIPVLATVPARAAIARVVDAGVLASRVPEAIRRPARRVLERVGAIGREGRAA